MAEYRTSHLLPAPSNTFFPERFTLECQRITCLWFMNTSKCFRLEQKIDPIDMIYVMIDLFSSSTC